MINYNGNIVSKNRTEISVDNRAFKYGDALFETIKIVNSKIIFGEDHYFRLMASIRMLRMKIPMEFTLEFFENEILKTIVSNKLTDARIRFSIFRQDGGLYLPENNAINYLIEAHELIISLKNEYEIDLFKDYYVYSGMLSTLKTNNRILNVVASIYVDENGLDNCILLNEKKHITEALNANIFLVKDNQIVTPSLSEGCLKGIMRKNIIAMLHKDSNYEIIEREISPFELQKVDEIFLSNSIIGIQAVTKYRKKTYSTIVSTDLQNKLKILMRMN
ncbi:MAG: aminotransferase class IV [Flavobacteriaceae bacterium]|nr:aminotransferase class IV [Flavobacteriaceae bacterium]